ncbi:MAG: hypothetical protein PF636_01335 [Actinomycetota bacterium]|jgi:Tfp pilus assembly protein PilN|nr:hypothetical protein [Actinomycetota bacterium]
MVRINLLPPEITEKRKYESMFGVVLIVGIVVLALVFAGYGWLEFQVGTKQNELQGRQTQAAQVLAQAEAFSVFEQREGVLDQRLATAQLALSGRVDWGRLVEELSLVLPDDTWVVSMRCTEAGLTLSCVALDDDLTSSDHKAVARTLIRLSQLEQLNNVWLSTSTKSVLSEGDWEQPIITFSVNTGVER